MTRAIVRRASSIRGASHRSRRIAIRRGLSRFAIHVALSAGAAIVLTPFFWMVSTSLKEESVLFLFPPQFIPSPVVWHNYVEAMTIVPFQLFFRNTVFVTGSAMVAETFSSALVAYSMSRLRWKGRDVNI